MSSLSWNAPTPLQESGRRCTVREALWDCMDAPARHQHHAPVRVLTATRSDFSESGSLRAAEHTYEQA